jgi:hypothetical protein
VVIYSNQPNLQLQVNPVPFCVRSVNSTLRVQVVNPRTGDDEDGRDRAPSSFGEWIGEIKYSYVPKKSDETCGDLDKNNPNLKRIQIINHRRKYFRGLTLFYSTIARGAAEGRAASMAVARHSLPHRHGGSRIG